MTASKPVMAEHVFEILVSSAYPFACSAGAKRMQIAKLGPGDRDHFGRGVELHRARAQRDHRAVERQVAVGQTAQIAQSISVSL